jgi:hypothetical protein
MQMRSKIGMVAGVAGLSILGGNVYNSTNDTQETLPAEYGYLLDELVEKGSYEEPRYWGSGPSSALLILSGDVQLELLEMGSLGSIQGPGVACSSVSETYAIDRHSKGVFQAGDLRMLVQSGPEPNRDDITTFMPLDFNTQDGFFIGTDLEEHGLTAVHRFDSEAYLTSDERVLEIQTVAGSYGIQLESINYMESKPDLNGEYGFARVYVNEVADLEELVIEHGACIVSDYPFQNQT